MEKNKLIDLYIIQLFSIRKVAKLCGLSASGVRYWLLKYNIPIRSRSQSQTGFLNHRFNLFGINNPRFGKKHTKELKECWSKLKSGINNPMYGKVGHLHPCHISNLTKEQRISRRRSKRAPVG